ncbi:MAG: hypothetical protein ACR2QB_03790 [Gammaproteobacteria bacterium]
MNTMTQQFFLGLVALSLLQGCQMRPTRENELRLPESPTAIRSLQTRTFSAPSETEVLSASIAVLQDMQFNIDRIEIPLGVITASKVSDAESPREKAALLFADMLCMMSGEDCGIRTTASDEQQLTLTLVVQPSLANTDEYVARVTLQRIVYDTVNRVLLKEPIHDPEIYQAIFDRLGKSIFFEVET